MLSNFGGQSRVSPADFLIMASLRRSLRFVLASLTVIAASLSIATPAFAVVTSSWDPSIGALSISMGAGDSAVVTCAVGNVQVNSVDVAGPVSCNSVITISVSGSTGAETINLGGVTLALFGSITQTTVTAGAGNDVVTGSEAEDILIGGAGADTVLGGLAGDTFVWSVGDGSDTTLNGGTGIGNDVVVISGTSSADTLSVTNSAGQYLWTGSATTTVAMEGVALNGGPYVSGTPSRSSADGNDVLTIASNVSGVLSIAGNGGADTLQAPFGSAALTDFDCGATNTSGDNATYNAVSSVLPFRVDEGIVTQDGVGGEANSISCRLSFAGVSDVAALAGGQFVALSPTRVFDSRAGSGYQGATGRFAAGETRTLALAGTAGTGVPAATTAAAAVLNVTVTGPLSAGFLTLYPNGVAQPLVSNINFVTDETRANSTTVKLPSSGAIAIFASQSVDVVIDVLGYYTTTSVALEPTGAYNSIDPVRILDTRPGTENNSTYTDPIGFVGPVAADSEVVLNLNGAGGLLAGRYVRAVVVNVTGVGALAPTFVTVYPSGTGRPTASNLNLTPGAVVPNVVVVPVGSDGKIRLFTQNATHLIVDVLGFFGGVAEVSTGGRFRALDPVRIFDSRADSGLTGAGTPFGPSATPIAIAGAGGVPAVASIDGAVLNMTVLPNASSYVTVWPADTATAPLSSNLNAITPGQPVANGVWTGVAFTGPNAGRVNVFFSGAGGSVIVDVAGYFTAP